MKNKHLIFSLIAVTAFAASSLAQDLVQWRGADRNGIYNETGLLKEWPATGPELLWSYNDLGKGYSSVTVVGDKIFTLGETDGTGYLFIFDIKGKLLSKTEYGKEWNESFPGSRSTPVYNKGKLYFATGLYEAICLDAQTGKKIWSVDMKAKFGAQSLVWGTTEAPVIDGNKVYFTPGGQNDVIVALNLNTGETIWKSVATNEPSACCSPLLYVYKNKKYLTTCLKGHVVGLDANDGKLLWQTPQTSGNQMSPNTPLYKDGQIYSVTGFKTGGVMLKLSDDGQSVTELWHNTTLDNQMGGTIWLGDKIIGSGHESDRSWQCLDAKTGLVIFKSNLMGKGAVIFADGLLYCYSDNGELGIMELNENGFNLKSKFRITMGSEQHLSHPVIQDGVLYLRRGNALMAYSIKK